MNSKLITDRQKSDTMVKAAATEHRPIIVERISEHFGEKAGAAAGVLADAVAETVAAASEEMQAADDRQTAEQGDDPAVRKERDDAAAAVRAIVIPLRGIVEVGFGPAFLKQLGFTGPTPEDPVVLHRVAAYAMKALGPMKPMPTAIEGYTFEPKKFADKLQAPLARLGKALEAVAVEEKQADETIVAKNRAVEKRDRKFSAGANLISALLAVAGEDELARRVRPTGRNPGTTAAMDEDAGETPAPTPEPGAKGSQE